MSDDEDDELPTLVAANSEAKEKGEEVTDLSNSDVCTKYQDACKIVNLALSGLVSQCVPGATIIDLCQFGTAIINTEASKLYTKKVNGSLIERGVAFPVCISVNELVCNHSPLASEELPLLQAGDIVKIDLGCHIDGYISVAAHTLVVPPAPGAPVDEAELAKDTAIGNVAVAAYNAMLIAAATLVAGNKNTDVTEMVSKVTECYGVNPISSVRMHQMKRFVIDGVKEVALRGPNADDVEGGEEKVPPCTFEEFEVYAVDVAVSTGDGRARPGEMRTTVYKRNVEANYKLKMKASRGILSEIDSKFPTMPFTMRHFDDERTAKLGITECSSHGLLTPYPILHERKGAKVAHFKCTVLLLPSGTARASGLPLPQYFNTDKVPSEEIRKMLEEIAAADAKKAAKKLKKKGKKKNSD
jgi:curved DNA binding protein